MGNDFNPSVRCLNPLEWWISPPPKEHTDAMHEVSAFTKGSIDRIEIWMEVLRPVLKPLWIIFLGIPLHYMVFEDTGVVGWGWLLKRMAKHLQNQLWNMLALESNAKIH